MFFKKKKNEVGVVKLNELTTSDDINELALVEIKDKKVINRVVSATPGAAQLVANTVTTIAANNVANAGVYQAILPSGASLVNSSVTEGAVRGMFQEGGKIAGHADFVAVDGTVEKIAAMNIANVAMGAASMVVGQYYMQQINAELNKITDGIAKLADFQKDDYKSRVFTLCTQVKRAADFQMEILEDASLRNEEILRLQALETTCMDLLNKANTTVERISAAKYADFDKYSEATSEISDWQKYQVMLANVLYTIADLNYTLHLGAMSPEQCYAAYDTTFKYTEKTINKIRQWHLQHEKSLGIDVDQAIVERKGIDAFIHKPLTLINDDFQYKKIAKQDVENIRIQKSAEVIDGRFNNNHLFMKDAKVIFKDGKVFYLPA